MKNFSERLKDILYDSADYVIMLAIIVGVVAIIGWRLDILFAKDNLDYENKEKINIETPSRPRKETTEVSDKDKSQNQDEDAGKDATESQAELEEPMVEDSNEHLALVTVNIPEGSLPSKIGSILESSGLVKDKNEFVLKAQEMNLDRKLRSGKYEIKKDSSLEEIVKIIARQI